MPKTAKAIAIIILSLMFFLLISSSWNDSLTMDELAHTPAGYSYLSQRDYRINPEHPPLIKDLAALPLLFLNLNFPSQSQAWQKDVNGQWDLGRIFMYESSWRFFSAGFFSNGQAAFTDTKQVFWLFSFSLSRPLFWRTQDTSQPIWLLLSDFLSGSPHF